MLLRAFCEPRNLRFSANAALTVLYPPSLITTAFCQNASSSLGEADLSSLRALVTNFSHSSGLTGKPFGIAFDFMFFGLAQTYDMNIIAALRIGHMNDHAVEKTEQVDSQLAI